MSWSRGLCAQQQGWGLWGSRKGGVRWLKETWIRKEVGERGGMRIEGAGTVAWIWKALEWAEQGTGSSGRERSEMQALAQGLQVRVEACVAIELGCEGLPPQKRQLQAGAPCVGMEIQVQDQVLACPSSRACLDTLLCRLWCSKGMFSLQGSTGLPELSHQAASSPVSSAGPGACTSELPW